jgi:hypothetical protein
LKRLNPFLAVNHLEEFQLEERETHAEQQCVQTIRIHPDVDRVPNSLRKF